MSAANVRVWITGGGGLIGHHLVRTAPVHGAKWRVISLTRRELDFTDFPALSDRFVRDKPQWIIHCAALSRSPDCQAQPALARRNNVDVTAVLAELAADIPFVLFSSDLVFDGSKGNYLESDRVHPLSVYAETKVAAEDMVLANPKHAVIRTSLNGGQSPAGNRAFNEELREAWRRGETTSLFVDEFRSPIPALVTAQAVWEFLNHYQPGLYHLAGSERLSRWQIGQLVAARWPQLKPRLEPSSLKDYTGAPRAPDTSLNSSKIQKLLSFPLPGLSDWLAANPKAPF